jgi:hypothetical protein
MIVEGQETARQEGKGTRNRVHSVAGGTPLGNMDSAPAGASTDPTFSFRQLKGGGTSWPGYVPADQKRLK